MQTGQSVDSSRLSGRLELARAHLAGLNWYSGQVCDVLDVVQMAARFDLYQMLGAVEGLLLGQDYRLFASSSSILGFLHRLLSE